MATRFGRLLGVVPLFSAAVLVAGLLSVLAPTADALLNSCSVRDVTAHTAKTGDLQQAIDSASAGDTLEIKGRCAGNFTIVKNLALLGKSHATLDGNSSGTVLTITGAVTVALRNLTVTKGNNAGNGGGILNNGGAVTLNAQTRVTGNYANDGGGIYIVGGSMTLDDHAQVNGNNAIGGGGIMNQGGSLTLTGHARVSGNTASYSGGIDNVSGGTFALTGRAQVTGNTPDNCNGC